MVYIKQLMEHHHNCPENKLAKVTMTFTQAINTSEDISIPPTENCILYRNQD